MIFDKVENIYRYGINFNLDVSKLNLTSFSKGKIDISNSKDFYIGLEYQTSSSDCLVWEAHKKYIDVHLLVEGEEFINIADISTMKSISEYQDDYQLFDGYPEQRIRLVPGFFLILFPNEVHQTGIMCIQPDYVKKFVYKLAF